MNNLSKMPALSNRANLFGLLGLFLLTVGAGFFLFAPLTKTRSAVAAQRMELTQDVQTVQDQMEQARKLRHALASAKDQLQAQRISLLDPSRINERIADLGELAQEAKLTVQRVQPGWPMTVGRYDCVPIRMLVRGSYPTCTSFMHSLHQRLVDISIESFQLRRIDEDGPAVAELQVDLIWFAAAQGDEPAPAAIKQK